MEERIGLPSFRLKTTGVEFEPRQSVIGRYAITEIIYFTMRYNSKHKKAKGREVPLPFSIDRYFSITTAWLPICCHAFSKELRSAWRFL